MASGLDNLIECFCLGVDRVPQVLQAGQQRCGRFEIRADVNGGGDHVVAALTHVDVVVRMDLAAQFSGRQRRNDLVGVHVCAGARAGLEDIERELVVVAAVGDFVRGVFNGPGHVGLHQSQVVVHRRRRTLDEPERAQEGARETQAADGEVVDGALRLR